MTWIILTLFGIAIIAVVVIKLSKSNMESSYDFPYQKIETLFSPAERSFLGVLNQAIGEHAQIFGKVRVADVITPKKGMNRSEWQKAFNKISRKHYDFLVCDKNDLSVLCAIELDDKSHNHKKRQERDAFLKSASNSASLPLIQIPAQASYLVNEIKGLFASFFPTETANTSETESTSTPVGSGNQTSEIADIKSCPKCSSEMVKKVAKKGKNAGSEFWACSAFPKCRYTEAINV